MKTKIATLALLTLTASSASANGGDALAGLVVGTVVGGVLASQPRAAVTVNYGGYAPPLVVYAPPPVVGYAPPPPLVGYAPPPPVAVYPAPRIYYGEPGFGFSYGHRHGHHAHRYGHGGWGQPRW